MTVNTTTTAQGQVEITHTQPQPGFTAEQLSRHQIGTPRRDKTETATARNRRVRREITSAMRDKRINLALCDFLQLVITECHLQTWAYHSRKEWAAIVGKSVSSIKL